VRSCWKLPPHPTEPVPAGSKMDLPLAKVKSISNDGSTSGMTYLRRGVGGNLCKLQLKRQVRETALQMPRSVQEEGRRCSRHRSRGSPAAMEQIIAKQAVPTAMEAHRGADPHLQPQGERHARAGGCPKEAVTL